MMEIEDDPDISLSIPIKPLYEEYQCPICFTLIKECFMTPCGHNFCKTCISECLDRKHSCPCCNTKTIQNQLIKNKQIDRIITILQEEKEKASKEYFENLIKAKPLGASSDNVNGANNNGGDVGNKANQQLSPIEAIFHRHMKKSLITFEDYYQKLKVKYEKTQEQLRTECTDKMLKTKEKYSNRKGLTPEQAKEKIDRKVNRLKRDTEEKIAALVKSFDECVQLLQESYDTYMSNAMPLPSFLPVTVTVYVPAKDIRFKNVVIKPTDNVKDLKSYLKEQFEKLGNPIKDWSAAVFTIKNRFEENNNKNKAESTVTDEERPILQYGLEPGAEIVISGPLLLKSDEPKQCFKDVFEKDKGQVMDYYTCKDCKYNWLCKNCAETCHKGHNITEYITNHKPTWACCYCAKNGKCQLRK